MKDKLFNALKQAYPQLGLSDEILKHHAGMLVATLDVNDENLQSIVSAQKDYLQGLQAENDKRATNAIAKTKAQAEEEKRKAVEDAVKAAIEEERKRAEDEAKKKAEEEAEKKRKAEQEKEEPEFMAKFRKELEEKEKAAAEREQALTKKLEDLLKTNETQGKTLSELQKENEAMKAEKAKTERTNLIRNIAKKLNIPDWRIDEGFVISNDADETSINETLSKIANNLKVNTLQGSGGLVLDDNKKVTQEEANAIADKLMK